MCEYLNTYSQMKPPHVHLLLSVAWKVSTQEIGTWKRHYSSGARTSALHLRNKVVLIQSRTNVVTDISPLGMNSL